MSAVTAVAPAAAAKDADGWVWPIDLDRYDRSTELTQAEHAAIIELGWDVRRARLYDREALGWEVIARLVRPLDDARDGLGWRPDTRYHRRCANDAIGLILRRCGEEKSSYWGWSSDDWLTLIYGNAIEFKRRWPGWVDGMVRAYLVAYAYLIGGFYDFQRLGPFNRVALAWRVFGRETIGAVIGEVDGLMQSWGYRCDDRSGRAALCQALLLNRSPRLADLSTEAFERIRRHPATAGHHRSVMHGIQRMAAELGYGAAPTRVHARPGPSTSRALRPSGPNGWNAGMRPRR